MTHHTIPQDIERSDDHQVKKETKHRNTYSYNSQHISAVKVAEKSFNTGQNGPCPQKDKPSGPPGPLFNCLNERT